MANINQKRMERCFRQLWQHMQDKNYREAEFCVQEHYPYIGKYSLLIDSFDAH